MEKKNEKTASEGFLSKILSLFGGRDPEAIRKKQLKEIAKEIARSKFKFYKQSGEEVLPALAKFFFDIYKIVIPAQLMLSNAQASGVLKQVVVENSLTEKQKKLIERLTEDAINERSKGVSVQELSRQVKEDISGLLGDITSERVSSIDEAYSAFLTFSAFVSFDYFFLLKKFDSGMQERSTTYVPKFEAIRCEYVKEDLLEFISVAWPITEPRNWQAVFEILKAYKGVEPVPLAVWSKIVNRVMELRRSQVLEMTLQLISGDPTMKITYSVPSERIVDVYLEKTRTQADLTVKKIERERVNSKSDELLNQLFGTTAVIRLKNYSESNNAVFERKLLGGYRYVLPLNYLKAFLIDYFKKDIREIADLMLVRGKWTVQNSATQMSEAYHTLLEVSNMITAFDESLEDDRELGSKIKTLLPRTERDKEAGKIIRTLLRDVNEKALDMLTSSAQNLIVFAKNLKNLLEDHGKQRPELLLNWKEIEHFSERPIREFGVEVYKKIFLFISLMQLYISDNKDSE